MQETFAVPDVSCGHCKSTIESALRPLDGVEDATVDVGGRSVSVTFDETRIGRDDVLGALDRAGYPARSL